MPEQSWETSEMERWLLNGSEFLYKRALALAKRKDGAKALKAAFGDSFSNSIKNPSRIDWEAVAETLRE